MKYRDIRRDNFLRRFTMEGIDKGLKTGRRGLGRCIFFFGLLLLLLLPAAGAYAQALNCADCHNPGGIPAPHSNGCRDSNCLQSCHPKDIKTMKHLSGPGTPITDPLTTDPSVITGICNTCHNMPWPGVYHRYRINTNAGSPTVPGVVDLDQSCGQCHGGGDNRTTNPPKPGVMYRTKAQLAPVASGMHSYAGVTYPVTFSSAVTPGTYTVNVAALVACGGTCPSFTYEWNWGDGTPLGSDAAASHTYATPGVKTITVAVRLASNGLIVGSSTRSMTVAVVDPPPSAGGSCIWTANTWTMTVGDATTDTNGFGPSPVSISVDWGDGTAKSFGSGGGTFPHVYAKTGTFTVAVKAVDSALQSSTYTCPTAATPAYFFISGTVSRSNTTTRVPSAPVTLRKGSTTVGTVLTNSSGFYQFSNLKPDTTYNITVAKSGFNFGPAPQYPIGTLPVGPGGADYNINAVSP
jgi:hypothetical protein